MQRRPRDSQHLGDGVDALTLRPPSARNRQDVFIDDRWPPAGPPLSLRGIQPRAGALADDVTLQLREGGHHGEEELALTGRRIDPESLPVRMRSPMSLPWRSSAMVRTSFTERPRRSNFQTHRVSPGRA